MDSQIARRILRLSRLEKLGQGHLDRAMEDGSFRRAQRAARFIEAVSGRSHVIVMNEVSTFRS
jgi:hypothetical protein